MGVLLFFCRHVSHFSHPTPKKIFRLVDIFLSRGHFPPYVCVLPLDYRRSHTCLRAPTVRAASRRLCHCQPFYLRRRFGIRLSKKSKSKWMASAFGFAANLIVTRPGCNTCCCQRPNRTAEFGSLIQSEPRLQNQSQPPRAPDNQKKRNIVSPVNKLSLLSGFVFIFIA